MKNINTISIENFLDKTRIANKSGQKTLVLDIKEAVNLADTLALVMTRLVGKLEENSSNAPAEEVIQVNMDGGGLR